MPSSPQNLGSPARLAALRRLDLLDTPAEPSFDRLTRLVGQFLGVPICLVSLVDDGRQFFKAALGLGGPVGEARQTPLSHSFCQHVVTSGVPLVVDDAPSHPKVCDNLAIRDLGVKAYLGIPIRSPDGFVIGSFCAIDVKARAWSPREVELMTEFTRLLETEIALRAARLESEIALKQHETVLGGTTSSVIATEPDGTIRVFNRGAERLLGYTAPEVVGRKTPELIHLAAEVEARAVKLSAELGRAIAPGFEALVVKARTAESDECEWTYVRKDGSRVPVLLTVTALRDGRGAITGFLGIARDITERIRLRESQENLAELLRQTGAMAQVGGWELDLATMQPFWSLETCRIHEVDPPVAPPLAQAINFYAPEARPVIEAAVRTAIAEGTPWDLELPLITARGRAIWVRAQGSVVRRQGVVVKLVGAFQDITARRVAEAAQRESEERFRALARHAPVGIYLTDAAGGCVYVNDRWSEITGVAAAAALGDGWGATLHPEDRGGVFAAWQALARGEANFAHEYRFRQADGSETWVAGQAVAMHDAAGGVTGFLGTIADVTERRQLLQSLAIARDQALEGSRLKSEFLATMSHEIRTPMNAVIGMAGLLIDTPLGAEQQEMTRVILNGGESLLAIMNDILDFSKMEAGKLRIEPAEFELRAVVEETLALLAPRAHAKHVELTCEFDAGLAPAFTGDAGRIRQVLTNLVSNAIKFTDEGAVEVGARLVRRTGGRTAFRVTVKDTGIGIAAEAQAQLFQPFTQADGTSTRRFGGTGLGLAICRQLVGLMGGEIGFTSEAGRGSSFWFELEAPQQAARSEEKPRALPEGLRVLLVDDNATNRRITLGQLAALGVQAEAVDGGPAALARLRECNGTAGRFHLVLLDWHMPGMDGLTLAVEIRADAALDRLPLVMLSSAGPIADPATATAVGFEAFLIKPVRETQLLNCLVRLAGQGKDLAGAAPAALPTSAAMRGGRGLRLLVAEDNSANQLVARMMLAKMGHTVEIAANGEQALAKLALQPYDAVLMDCQMPVLDGYAATRRIRSGTLAGVDARIPIVAVTAYAMPDDRLKCLQAGMDDFLTKPVRAAEVQGVLLRLGLLKPGTPGVPANERTPAQPVAAEAAIDAAWVETMRALPGRHGPSLLPELTAMFLREEPARLAQLGELVAAREGEPLARLAHTMAGSAANFGAKELRAAAIELERAATAGAWSEVVLRFADVQKQSVRVHAALARLSFATNP